MMFAKIHLSRRHVVAICDSDIMGKTFEEGIKILHLRENFYKGEEMSFESIIKLIKTQAREDATFNIAGQESVRAAIAAGLVDEKSIGRVSGIPFVLKLL